ncbi:MAG: hypothetical protein ABIQ04_04860 [Candidatus Saccharimonadales bacterium]
MNPNQEEYSIDYLNQIAAPAKKPGLDKKFLLLIGGGLLFAIILVVVLVSLGNGGNASPSKLQTLEARINTLSTISTSAKQNIKSNSLRTTNANLIIFLTNADRDGTAPLLAAGVAKDKIDKAITAAESGDTLKKTLEDARLNATYDRTYAREMDYQLETLSALMKGIYESTSSKSMKDFLDTTDTNLATIRKQLSDFSDTTS